MNKSVYLLFKYIPLKKSAHGNPILIGKNNIDILSQISQFSEKDIQQLIFDNPECLPISDLDESYNPIIPVCKELNTNAGPLDILMVTPNGDLAIIETKLWTNPESRRKVVAQILDYAKEMCKWTYSDLQREVNRNLDAKGNHLYDLVLNSSHDTSLNEIDFVDAVSRNLRTGKFMLIIAGDGIREGAKNLAEFINQAGNLNFSLAMIELPVFETPNGETLIIPRTVVKTIEIQKINIEIPEGFSVVSSYDNNLEKSTTNNEPLDEEWIKVREFFTSFWEEYVNQLQFDDPEQPMPKPYKMRNLFINPSGDEGNWISCYFMASKKRVGVYFKFRDSPLGMYQKEQLHEYKDDIKTELGDDVIWNWDNGKSEGFEVRLNIGNVYSTENKIEIIEFFNKWTNIFVNVMRPKLKSIQ